MKLKIFAALLLTIGVASVGVTIATPNATPNKTGGTNTKATTPAPRARMNLPQDPEGTIDGAKNPEQISDLTAYSLFFRFLSGRRTEAEKNRAKAYLQQMLRGPECGQPGPSENAQITAILAVAEGFERWVGVLDRQAKEIKGRAGSGRSAEVLGSLKQLQKQKEAIVADVMASLPSRLGGEGAEKMRQHINSVFKRKMKVRPGRRPDRAAPADGNVA